MRLGRERVRRLACRLLYGGVLYIEYIHTYRTVPLRRTRGCANVNVADCEGLFCCHRFGGFR